jgi:hypothetical protein
MNSLRLKTTSGPAGATRRRAQVAAARTSQRRATIVSAGEEKRGVRGLEDFVLGGPKLRKWYGQEDEVRIRDGGAAEGPAESDGAGEDGGPKDVVLVTDGESSMGEQVVLQLILARWASAGGAGLAAVSQMGWEGGGWGAGTQALARGDELCEVAQSYDEVQAVAVQARSTP